MGRPIQVLKRSSLMGFLIASISGITKSIIRRVSVSLIMSKTNKFNIAWQLTRVNARQIKGVEEKIDYVLNFLEKNRNHQNYERVMNWLKMTKLGYHKSQEAQAHFDIAIMAVNHSRDEGAYNSLWEDLEDFSDYKIEDLIRVQQDISQRKNGFQHKGKAPKDQVEFMARLEDYLETIVNK